MNLEAESIRFYSWQEISQIRKISI